MWYPFKSKKTTEKQTKNIRIDAEDLIEQGYTCAEIAEELNITQEEVYRIKQAKGRRDARARGTNPESEDKISQLKEELATVELQDRIDEAKHKAFLRQQERDEYLSEDIEEVTENPDSLIQTLLLQAFLKGQGLNTQTNNIPIISPQSQQGEVSVSSQADKTTPLSSPAGVDFNQIEQGIKHGLISEERFIKEAEILKLSPDKAKKLYTFIKNKI